MSPQHTSPYHCPAAPTQSAHLKLFLPVVLGGDPSLPKPESISQPVSWASGSPARTDHSPSWGSLPADMPSLVSPSAFLPAIVQPAEGRSCCPQPSAPQLPSGRVHTAGLATSTQYPSSVSNSLPSKWPLLSSPSLLLRTFLTAPNPTDHPGRAGAKCCPATSTH